MNTPVASRFGMVARQELRLLLAERSLWLVGALFLALIAYALYNGTQQVTQRDRAQAELVAADAQQRGAQRARLDRVLGGAEVPGPFNNPANPVHMAGGYGGHHVWMPSAPLAPVALGQSDLYPSHFKVTHHSKVTFLHNNDIENPWHLLAGHFDLAFVVVYLLPLLIFALSYNLLSAERESGTLRLLLSQPLSLRTLVLAKVVVRAGVLVGMAVLVPLAVLLATRPAVLDAGAAVAWWALLVGGYAAFWFALVVAVNAFGRSSATNAMVLVIAWVVLVLVAPVLLNLAVAAAEPSPSRAELATRTRTVTAAAMARNASLLGTDYDHVGRAATPMAPGGKVTLSARSVANYAIQKEVDAETQQDLDRFDRQQARQQALVARFAVLSPAAVAHEAMTALAGTGAGRYADFMAQTDAFHRAWKAFFYPRIDAAQALAPADFARIPAFAWREAPQAQTHRDGYRFFVRLAVPTLLLFALAAWRLRRYRVV